MSSVLPVVGAPDAYDALPPLTEAQRVADTFFAPSRTFADIRRNRSWWLPLVLLAVFGYMFSATLVHRLGPAGLVDSALRANPKNYEKFKDLSADQQATQRHFIGVATTTSLYTFPLIQMVFAAFEALLLWVGFNFMLGGSSTYGGMFAVSMFAALPGILRAVLGTVMLFVGDLDSFSLQDPVGTNPGYYLAPTSAAWLRSLLGSFDLFTLWILFLSAGREHCGAGEAGDGICPGVWSVVFVCAGEDGRGGCVLAQADTVQCGCFPFAAACCSLKNTARFARMGRIA